MMKHSLLPVGISIAFLFSGLLRMRQFAAACQKWVWTCAVLAILLPSISGSATAQQLTVLQLAVGNLFGGNNVLSYYGTTGSFLGVFAAGDGLSDPEGLAVGRDGNLYVSSYVTNQVLRYNGATGAFIDVFVPANSGGLSSPEGLVFGPDRNLYVASWDTNSVLRYDGSTGTFLGTFASGGGLVNPFGIVFGPDANLYVAGSHSSNVLRYNGVTGMFMDVFVPPGSGGLLSPGALTFGPDRNLYLTNNQLSGEQPSSVLRYNGITGAFIDAFVGVGSGGLNAGRGLVFGPDRNLYVSSFRSNQVLRYNGTNGAFIDAFVPAGSGGLNGPRFLIFAPRIVVLSLNPGGRPCARPDIPASQGQ